MTEQPDPWAAARYVHGRLVHHQLVSSGDGILPEACALLAGRISQFVHTPVTEADMAKIKEAGRLHADHRAVLNQAAALLRQEMDKGGWRRHAGLHDHVRRWDEAIQVLQMPRGSFDNSHSWLQASKTGDHIRPWTYMAIEVTGFVLQVIRSPPGRDQERINVSALSRFVQEVLTLIGTDVPSKREIQKKMIGQFPELGPQAR